MTTTSNTSSYYGSGTVPNASYISVYLHLTSTLRGDIITFILHMRKLILRRNSNPWSQWAWVKGCNREANSELLEFQIHNLLHCHLCARHHHELYNYINTNDLTNVRTFVQCLVTKATRSLSTHPGCLLVWVDLKLRWKQTFELYGVSKDTSAFC